MLGKARNSDVEILCRNAKAIYLAPLESSVVPLEIPLAKGGESFWLDSRTVGYVEAADKELELYAVNVKYETEGEGRPGVLSAPDPPTLLGTFPTTTASNFRYSPHSRYLVFSDYVYPDGNLESVGDQDDIWESRGNSAFVYDSTFVRHWDTWVGPKRSSLFSVRLFRDPDHQWHFGSQFINPLKDTGHVNIFCIITHSNSEQTGSRALPSNHLVGLMTSMSRGATLCTHRRIQLCLKPGIPSKMSVTFLSWIFNTEK
jgi:hypothetical protein